MTHEIASKSHTNSKCKCRMPVRRLLQHSRHISVPLKDKLVLVFVLNDRVEEKEGW